MLLLHLLGPFSTAENVGIEYKEPSVSPSENLVQQRKRKLEYQETL
jgi:hypothetical protein